MSAVRPPMRKRLFTATCCPIPSVISTARRVRVLGVNTWRRRSVLEEEQTKRSYASILCGCRSNVTRCVTPLCRAAHAYHDDAVGVTLL